MLRPFVQETGRLLDHAGLPVVLGVDRGLVTITAAMTVARLDQVEALEFARLYADAIQLAAAQAAWLEE
jgi:hypothetical protein